GYAEGQFWLNQTLNRMYQLMDITAGVATWRETGGGGGSLWPDRGIVTLATNVLDASAGPGLYHVAAETGTADQLDQITGLAVNECVRIVPDTGDTITVADGASLNLQTVNFVMGNVNDIMELMNSATGVCREIVRSSND
ncbi:MAG: hypothetical protein Q8O94_03295, partial [bacterium]|nr:hypothetical protein [bacterium]